MASHKEGPPNKRRRTTRIRRPTERISESTLLSGQNNDNEINTPVELNDNNSCSSQDDNQQIISQFKTMLDSAIPVITQTVISALKQSGYIGQPQGQSTGNSTVTNSENNSSEEGNGLVMPNINYNNRSAEQMTANSNDRSAEQINANSNDRSAGQVNSSCGSLGQINLNGARNTGTGVTNCIVHAHDGPSTSSAQHETLLNSLPNVNVVDHLLQSGIQNVCSLPQQNTSNTPKKVGLSRPLALRVDPKIKAQIWANEFIEFGILLKSDNEKFKFVPEEKEDQIIFTKQKANPLKIENMTQWLAAFHIFVAIFCERCPLEAPNLMKYANIISSLSKQSGVEGALHYDKSFRQWRQKDPDSLPWEGVVTELHCEALAMGLQGQTKKQNSKWPFRTSFGRPKTGGPTTIKQHCYTFNNEGYCTNQRCRFGHFCQICKQNNHGKKNCPNQTPTQPKIHTIASNNTSATKQKTNTPK